MVNKKEFIDIFATKRGISKSQAEAETEAFLEAITESCVNRGGVSFKGLFTLKKDVRKGRKCHLNGKDIVTEDKNILKLTVGSSLNKLLNQ